MTQSRRFISHYIVLTIMLLAHKGLGQESYFFPVQGYSVDDFSSSYGPRNLSPSLENYPAQSYDYDFHAGIDIGAPEGTNIVPVMLGIVHVEPGESDIIIEHVDDDGVPLFLAKYNHLTPSSSLAENDTVTGGVTILGTLDDHPGGSHLDIRYYPEGHIEALDINAENPTRILGIDETTDPIIVDQYGNDKSGGNWQGIGDQEDPGTAHGNPAGKTYFEFGVRVLDDELDMNYVSVELAAYTAQNSYVTEDLLDMSSDPWFPDRVNYEWRYNSGDQSEENDDIGHNSSSVGIYPRAFSKTDPYHTVYFRWYVNEDIWINLNEAYLTTVAMDWKWNSVDAYDIPLDLCVDCSAPPSAPKKPTLNSLANDPVTGVNHLEWTPDFSGEYATFFKIYRSPSSRQITDGDVVGITVEVFYDDNERDLEQGTEYRYAVSGVNEKGEGYNSNELLVMHQNEPPSKPSLSLSGSWGQNPTLSWTDGGEADIDHFVLKKKYVNSNGTLIQCVDPVTSPYTDPMITINPKFGDTQADYWVKAVDRAGQNSLWSNKKSTTGDGPVWKQTVTNDLPERFGLGPNYPNPFNPVTTIKYDLPENSSITLKLYDLMGQEIATLVNGNMDAGYQNVIWDGKD